MLEHTDRSEKIKELVFQKLSESVHTDVKNGIIHLSGVAYLSGYIALKRDLNIELCICAGFLHDLWLYYNMPLHPIVHEKHGHNGSELAMGILKETGLYNDDEMEIICRMIYNHNDKRIIHDEYSEALKDADVLQHYLNNSEYDKKYNDHGRLERLIQNNINNEKK